MELHGQAMLDYLNGEEDAYCILRRDDGVAYPPIYGDNSFTQTDFPNLIRLRSSVALEECLILARAQVLIH